MHPFRKTINYENCAENKSHTSQFKNCLRTMNVKENKCKTKYWQIQSISSIKHVLKKPILVINMLPLCHFRSCNFATIL